MAEATLRSNNGDAVVGRAVLCPSGVLPWPPHPRNGFYNIRPCSIPATVIPPYCQP